MGKKTKVALARLKRGKFTVPSPHDVIAAMSPAGAWTAITLAEWGVPWPPPHGWREALEYRWFELGGYPPGEDGNPSEFPIITANYLAHQERNARRGRAAIQRLQRPTTRGPTNIQPIPDGEMPWDFPRLP